MVYGVARQEGGIFMALSMTTDVQLMARKWWAVALRGLISVIFGIIAFAWPQLTAALMVMFFGVYVFIDGLFALIASFSMHGGLGRWWLMLIEGILGIVLGLIFLFNPAFTAAFLLILIAIWAIVTGIIEIVLAITYAKIVPDNWLMILTGILSLIFGFLLMRNPAAGILAVIWIIGMYAILFGVMVIAAGFTLKGLLHQTK